MKELEAYYRKNFVRLVNQTKGQVGGVHAAQDAVQEAFTRAIEYHDTFDGRNFGAWFQGILANSIRTQRRNERFRGVTLDENADNLIPFHPTPTFLIMLKEIETDIGLLENPKHREMLSLYFLKQYSPKEISEITDDSAVAVRQVVYRYREDLKYKYGESLYR